MNRSVVHDYLKLRHQFDNQDIVLAYYFRYQDKDTLSSTSVTASLFQQVLQYYTGALPPLIQEFYKKNRKENVYPLYTDILKMIQIISTNFTRVFLLFDAEDECPPHIWDELLAHFNHLGSQLHFLVTSRNPKPIMRHMIPAVSLEIKTQLSDMCIMINNMAHIRQKFLLLTDDFPNLLKAVQIKVSQKADGRCVISHIL